MTKKKRSPLGSSVQDWFDEEEAKKPGFLVEIDEKILRESAAASLKKLREKSSITQAELARRIGVKQPVIARVESGKVMPDLRTVHRIAHALGYMVNELTFRPMPGKTPILDGKKKPPGTAVEKDWTPVSGKNVFASHGGRSEIKFDEAADKALVEQLRAERKPRA